MEPFGSILGALGSIASIVSLAAVWRANRSWLLRFSFVLIFLLTASSSYFSYQYYQVTKPEAVRKAKQIELRTATKDFLADNPLDSSYWSPGQNEGIVKSGLIILELYRVLYPETYIRIKQDAEADISFAKQHRDSQVERQVMDAAAKSMLTIFKTLSAG